MSETREMVGDSAHSYCQHADAMDAAYRCNLPAGHEGVHSFGPLDTDGNLIPSNGTIRPTRADFGTLLQAIVEDAGGPDASLAQPLAEHFVRYLDGVYGPREEPSSDATGPQAPSSDAKQ